MSRPNVHRRRARRLARPALHTGLHEPGEGGVDGRALIDSPHGRDPPPGRQALLAGHPVGRAVGQAQPAGHAGGQIVGVDAERPPGR